MRESHVGVAYANDPLQHVWIFYIITFISFYSHYVKTVQVYDIVDRMSRRKIIIPNEVYLKMEQVSQRSLHIYIYYKNRVAERSFCR